eukprot:s662_g22.t1
MATSRVSSGEAEANAMESLKKLEYDVQPLASLACEKVRGVKLITELLQPVQDLLKECEKKVSALKVGKAPAKATKEEATEAKLSNRAHERLHVVLAGHEKAFGAAVQTLLQAELKANLKHLLGEGRAGDDATQPVSLAELDELLPSIQHTCIVEHGFWKHGSATGQVGSILKDYEAVSTMLCAMFKFVRDTNQKKQVDVAPADLSKWRESLPKRLPDWIGKDLSQRVQDQCLKICEGKAQALTSEGFAAMGQVVDQCLAGKVPTLSAEDQQRMLLNIPRGKELKGLAAAFLEALSFWQF